MTSDSILLWLGLYALHSTLFLGAVWLIDRLSRGRAPALVSAFWRTALFAGIVSATLQAGGLVSPVAGRFAVLPAQVAPISDLPPASAVAPTAAVIIDTSVPAGATEAAPAQLSAAPSTVFAFEWPPVGPILLGVWGAVVALLSLRAGFMWRAAHRELRGRQPVVQGPLFERIQALAHDIGLRRLPQVSFSDNIDGPFTLPNGEICIPVWARERLPKAQLDAMLAHEMAHVLHRDSLWLAIGMAVDTVFFFQPLNSLARRRLAHLAEFTADDWAATRAGSGRPLAECIVSFVHINQSQTHGMAAPAFAAAMAKPKSELLQRVERLLNNRYTTEVLPMKTRVFIGASALVLAAFVPGLSAQAYDRPLSPKPAQPEIAQLAPEATAPKTVADNPAPAPEPQQHISISRNDDSEVRMNVSTSRDGFKLTANANGKFVLGADGVSMVGRSAGSYIDATLSQGGQTRRLRLSGEGSSRREFWVGGQSRAWGAEADAFVAELMPILFRETGILADKRVDWLLQKRGEDALLGEIGQMNSDTVQRIYASLYSEKAHLNDQHLQQLLAIIGKQMDSDTDARLTLTTLYQTQKPTGHQLATLLRTASSIGSDTDTRLMLTSVGKAALDSDEAMAAYLDIARSIGSDTDLRLTLSDVVASSSISDSRIQQAVALAGDAIKSDTDLRLVLGDSAPRVGASSVLAAAYLKALQAINSSTDRRLALLALADEAKLDAGSWRSFLDATAGMNSSTDKRLVLTGVAGKLPRQPDLVAAYNAAAQTISGQTDRGLALGALH